MMMTMMIVTMVVGMVMDLYKNALHDSETVYCDSL